MSELPSRKFRRGSLDEDPRRRYRDLDREPRESRDRDRERYLNQDLTEEEMDRRRQEYLAREQSIRTQAQRLESTLRGIHQRVDQRKKKRSKPGIASKIFKREDGSIDYGKWIVIGVVILLLVFLVAMGSFCEGDDYCNCRV